MIADRDCRITLVCDNHELCVTAQDRFLRQFSQQFMGEDIHDCLWNATLRGWRVEEDEEFENEASHYCPRCEAARMGVTGANITMNLRCNSPGYCDEAMCARTEATFYGGTVEECAELARKAGWSLVMGDAYCPDCTSANKQDAPDVAPEPKPDPADTALANGRWLYENWQKYLGQWVALDNGRLVAAGDAHLVFAMAKEWPNKCLVTQVQEPAKG